MLNYKEYLDEVISINKEFKCGELNFNNLTKKGIKKVNDSKYQLYEFKLKNGNGNTYIISVNSSLISLSKTILTVLHNNFFYNHQ